MIRRLRQLAANMPTYLQVLGWRGVLDFARIRYSSSLQPRPLHLRGRRDPLWLRPASTDLMTFREIFLARDYDFGLPGPVYSIVDAGANIGLAAVFFAHAHPQAQVIAIEPEQENFRLLERNAAPYPNIVPLRAALWASAGEVELADPGRGENGFVVGAPQERVIDRVTAVTVAQLLERYGIARLGLLKIDIEGSEKEVFEAADPWIDRVDTVVAELHDRFKPGCHEAFVHATQRMSPGPTRGKLASACARTAGEVA